MAIAQMKKITLVGTQSQKEKVIAALQQLGCVHLENLTPGTGEGQPENGYSQDAYDAWKYLRHSPIQRPPAPKEERIDASKLTEQLHQLQTRQKDLEEERAWLHRRIQEMEPWGDFQLPEESEIEGQRLWFYCVAQERMPEVPLQDYPSLVVSRRGRFAYFVVIAPDEPKEIPVDPISLEPGGVGSLHKRLEEVEVELEEIHWERAELSRWSHFLQSALHAADDLAARRHAAEKTLDAEQLFALQGWVSQGDLSKIARFSKKWGLVLVDIDPEEEEKPPTKFVNPSWLDGGESAVKFYMIPGYHTWDPSMVMLLSFSAFFGMIISDAGYGLLLVLLMAFFWKKMGKSKSGIHFRRLAVPLTVATVVYGVLVGNYFGIQPSRDTVLGALRIPWIDPNDQIQMMSITIVLGAIHIILANLISAWKYRKNGLSFSYLGWCFLIIGGLFAGFEWQNLFDPEREYLPIDATLLGVGIVLILGFSSKRDWTFSPKGLLLRGFDGIKSVANVSQLFSDVLSYLRLFALALASTKLAVTFNELASDMWNQAGFGVLMAILIIVLGHSMNFVLALMSGVVHGLRLVCIEFFHWSLPEEGILFQPFRKKKAGE